MSTCYIKKEACCYNNKVKEMKKLEKPQKYLSLIETQCNLEPFFVVVAFCRKHTELLYQMYSSFT